MKTSKRLLLSDDEIATIAYEAFMVGRVYTKGGEKEPPAEIHTKLMLSVGAALVRYRQAERKRRRPETTNLTPALWAILRDERDIEGTLERLAHGVALTEPERGNEGFYAWRPRADHMHALAALALDQLPDTDPRKITWAMVDGIRALASHIDMSNGQCRFCGYRDSMPSTHDNPVHECPIFLADQWADALAALLPPR